MLYWEVSVIKRKKTFLYLACVQTSPISFGAAEKEIGDVYTQAIFYPENVREIDQSFEEFTYTRR